MYPSIDGAGRYIPRRLSFIRLGKTSCETWQQYGVGIKYASNKVIFKYIRRFLSGGREDQSHRNDTARPSSR